MRIRELLETPQYPQYLYHATSSRNILSIWKHGLIANGMSGDVTNWGGDLGYGSMGKIFLADRPETAEYYGEIIQRGHRDNLGMTGLYMFLLRIPTNSIKGLVQDPHARGDYFTPGPISPEYIEVMWGGHGWKPLRTLDKATVGGPASGEWDDEEEWEDDGDEMNEIAVEAA